METEAAEAAGDFSGLPPAEAAEEAKWILSTQARSSRCSHKMEAEHHEFSD